MQQPASGEREIPRPSRTDRGYRVNDYILVQVTSSPRQIFSLKTPPCLAIYMWSLLKTLPKRMPTHLVPCVDLCHHLLRGYERVLVVVVALDVDDRSIDLLWLARLDSRSGGRHGVGDVMTRCGCFLSFDAAWRRVYCALASQRLMKGSYACVYVFVCRKDVP